MAVIQPDVPCLEDRLFPCGKLTAVILHDGNGRIGEAHDGRQDLLGCRIGFLQDYSSFAAVQGISSYEQSVEE